MHTLAEQPTAPDRRDLAYGVSILLQMALPLAIVSAVSGVQRGLLYIDAGSNTALLSNIAQGVIGSLAIVALPWLGLLAACVMTRRAPPPEFYIGPAKVLAWAWLLFVPLGTVLGGIHLRQLRRNRYAAS